MHFIVYDVNRHTRVFQIKIGKKTNPAIIGPMHNCLLFPPPSPYRFVCYSSFQRE
ncbi:Uncharacterized protein APZ42_005567 [Daphnia magna]|uniref:Uncharacterized protein n=1 Tax=Daphnia magna TaxID=35525 RepID=A0A162CT70_9CRUS|nr:Uncharacterized protein APZ42_005567 [Daphnia magna]